MLTFQDAEDFWREFHEAEAPADPYIRRALEVAAMPEAERKACAQAAWDKAVAAIEAQASKTGADLIQLRYEDYCREPWQLDAINPRLRSMAPKEALNCIIQKMNSTTCLPMAPEPLINLAAAKRWAEARLTEQHEAAEHTLRRDLQVSNIIEHAKQLLQHVPRDTPHAVDLAQAIHDVEKMR